MRLLIFLLFITLLIFSCEDETGGNANACDLTDSFGETHWISGLKKSITNCSCEISIIKGTYAGQSVFFVALTDPLCNGVNTPTLYNCEGKEIRTFTSSPADQEALVKEVTRESVLYRCKS